MHGVNKISRYHKLKIMRKNGVGLKQMIKISNKKYNLYKINNSNNLNNNKNNYFNNSNSNYFNNNNKNNRGF